MKEYLHERAPDRSITEWLNEMSSKDGWHPIGCNIIGGYPMWTFERETLEDMDYQTRRHSGELRHYATLEDALNDAKNPEVWKISFWDVKRENRIRLVRESSGDRFYLDPIDLKRSGV